MKRTKFLIIFILIFTSFINALQAAETYNVEKITVLRVDSTINPATFQYLKNNFKKLSKSRGDLVFIKLNTPGGLVSSTKDIIGLIGELDIPVGIWVTPEGASATSAGAIIASSSHILVMSEGTNIGAATPIGMGKDIDQKDSRNKAVNDLSALVSSLSKTRGRNPKKFVKMITEAKSLDAKDALESQTIDHIVNSTTELLDVLKMKKLKIKGNPIELNLSANIQINSIEMDLIQRILNFFADPTMAYLLFVIGAILIYFEFQTPGGFIAGSLGSLCLALAAIGFKILPLNIGGMGLIFLAFILFVLEIYITSFGVLTLLAITSLVTGSLFLFETQDSLMAVEPMVIFTTVLSIVLYAAFIGIFFLKTYKKRKEYFPSTGKEGHVIKLLGKEDKTYFYQIKIESEIWNAFSNINFEVGDRVLTLEENKEKLSFKITTFKNQEDL